jgi:hypothetical protein
MKYSRCPSFFSFLLLIFSFFLLLFIIHQSIFGLKKESIGDKGRRYSSSTENKGTSYSHTRHEMSASPRVGQNLLGKSCVLPTFKKLYKVKKESSPTTCHNSLVKSRSNLHEESWEKQNYVCALPALEKLTSGILLYSLFLFHPPT